MAINATSYGLSTQVPWPQDEAIERVTAALKEEGFEILTTIDVQATLKDKLGVDTDPYVILGSCNPQLAHQALEAELEIGLLLPCNVVVYQASGSTTVAVMDPQAAPALTGNAEVEPLAREAKVRLERVLNRLADTAVTGITRSSVWLLALLLLAAVLGGCTATGDGPFGRGDSRSYDSNGERIYFSSESDSGDRISSEGGPGRGMTRGSFACADCHGDDGQGGRVRMMMQSFEAPAITWSALTEEHDGHGDEAHPPYTEETLKRAIREGVDPAGDSFDSLMPRWEISERDLDDLVAFLKSLDADDEH